MDNLRVLQTEKPDQIKRIPANRADKLTDEIFKKELGSHTIPSYEAHLYHVAMEARQFHPQTGKRESVARIQIFTPEAYASHVENEGFLGYTSVELVHDPRL